MKTQLYSLTAEPKSVTISDAVFGADFKPSLIAQAIHVYRSNLRQGGAKTKRRGEVTLTGAKWYRQKGTGNARHGAKSAPIFVGGGVAHGPTGMENFKKSLPQKMARKATVYALSAQAAANHVLVVADLDKLSGKTKEAADFMASIQENAKEKVLVIIDTSHDTILNALNNVARVTVTRADRVNALEVAMANKVVIMQPALELLEARLIDKKDKAAQ